MNIIFPEIRRFQLWCYIAGHSTLILRSLKEQNMALGERFQMLCTSVGRIDLPTSFSCSSIVFDDILLKDQEVRASPSPVGNERIEFYNEGALIGFVETTFLRYTVDAGFLHDLCSNRDLNSLLSLGEAQTDRECQ